MHLLQAKAGAVSDGSEAVDLGQTPGDIVVLTAADSELASLSAAAALLDEPRPKLDSPTSCTLDIQCPWISTPRRSSLRLNW